MAGPHRKEEWLRERWYSDMTLTEIGDEAGVTGAAVSHAASDFGFPPKDEARAPHLREEWLRERWFSEMTVEEIAEEAGAERGAVTHAAHDKFDLPRKDRVAPFWDEEWLRERWFSERTVKSIAAEVDVDQHTITNRAQGFGFPPKDEATPTPWRDPELLEELYLEQEMSMVDIGDELGVSAGTIHKWLRRADIDPRRSNVGRASVNPHPYFRTDPDGYERVSSGFDGEVESAGIHQLLAIAHGADPHRLFSDGEYHVHHSSGVPWDNRPGNIGVLTRPDHARNHRLREKASE